MRSLRTGRRGQAVIELTVVAGFLVLLLVGIIGFGSILQASIRVQAAAREGARVATTGGTNQTIRESVLSNLSPQGDPNKIIGEAAIAINPSDEAARVFNSNVTVQVWYSYPVPVPLFNLVVREKMLYAEETMVVTTSVPAPAPGGAASPSSPSSGLGEGGDTGDTGGTGGGSSGFPGQGRGGGVGGGRGNRTGG